MDRKPREPARLLRLRLRTRNHLVVGSVASRANIGSHLAAASTQQYGAWLRLCDIQFLSMNNVTRGDAYATSSTHKKKGKEIRYKYVNTQINK